MQNFIELIAKEREDQITKHARTIEYDKKENSRGELVSGAVALLDEDNAANVHVGDFPAHWDNDTCIRMLKKSYQDRLIIAAALIVAELERINS